MHHFVYNHSFFVMFIFEIYIYKLYNTNVTGKNILYACLLPKYLKKIMRKMVLLFGEARDTFIIKKDLVDFLTKYFYLSELNIKAKVNVCTQIKIIRNKTYLNKNVKQ